MSVTLSEIALHLQQVGRVEMISQEQHFYVILNIFITISSLYFKTNCRFKNVCEGLPVNGPA